MGKSRRVGLSGEAFVPRRGCFNISKNQSSGGGYDDGTGGLPDPQAGSPVVIRIQHITTLWLDGTQAFVPATIMNWSEGLYFDYNCGKTGEVSLNNYASEGVQSTAWVGGGGAHGQHSFLNRLSQSLWGGTAAQFNPNASYETWYLKLQILFWINSSSISYCKARGRWIDSTGTYFNTTNGTQSDSSLSLASFPLYRMSDENYTTWKVIISKVNTGWTYTATQSYSNIAFYRRVKDATDDIWVDTPISF